MKKTLISLTVFIMLFSSVLCVSADSTDHVLDHNGDVYAIPTTYTPKQVIMDFGNGDTLKEPQDLFITADDKIFVADAGNNRIVQLDENGQLVKTYNAGGSLSSPQGVYISKYANLFVADTGNQRICSINTDDTLAEVFTKPKSDLLSDSSDFAVRKVYISAEGYIYTIKGQQFMMIDSNDAFKGFVGANDVGFSLKRTLIRMFATEEQKRKIETVEPPPYHNFLIADDGMIYAVAATSTAQIKKLNATGKNIFTTTYVTEPVRDEKGYTLTPSYVDIAVDKNGIISILEEHSGVIYQYDQEGNMLTAFGGLGYKCGRYVLPCSLAVDSKGNIYVLDSSTGYIHILEPTTFIKEVKSAVADYENGEYQSANAHWQAVAAIDVNYPLANRGIGQAYYKAGEYKKAMEYFKLAIDRGEYGLAFDDYWHAMIKAYFWLFIIIVSAFSAAVIFLVAFAAKKATKFVNDYYFSNGRGKRH